MFVMVSNFDRCSMIMLLLMIAFLAIADFKNISRHIERKRVDLIITVVHYTRLN